MSAVLPISIQTDEIVSYNPASGAEVGRVQTLAGAARGAALANIQATPLRGAFLRRVGDGFGTAAGAGFA